MSSKLLRSRDVDFHYSGSVITRACEQGIYIDLDALECAHQELRDVIDEDATRLEEIAWEGININSNNEMTRLFVDILESDDCLLTTKTGRYSFNAESMESVVAECDNPVSVECAELVSNIRSNTSKANKLQELYAACDGELIHPRWSHGETYRISYNSPGISNIPKEVRGIFKAPKGYKIVSFDYSQQEPWILFHRLRIKELIKLTEEYQDTYRAMGNIILGKKEVTKEERNRLKIAWLATSYGAGVRTIASQVRSKEFAKKFHSTINGLPQIADEHRIIRANINQGNRISDGYFGTKREVPHYGGGYTARAIFNGKFQITGSEILMFAIEDIDKYLAARNYTPEEARIYFTMHDQVLMLIKDNCLNIVDDIYNLIAYQVVDDTDYEEYDSEEERTWLPFKLEQTISDTY